ncbi:MAG: hypothetical protein KatS3mg113_0228 [Planctomycetaceae bacterium]|nr:MAG: hypothetical protein KatS3mg113_0228 [Planctomycetaceae bacterium]
MPLRLSWVTGAVFFTIWAAYQCWLAGYQQGYQAGHREGWQGAERNYLPLLQHISAHYEQNPDPLTTDPSQPAVTFQ